MPKENGLTLSKRSMSHIRDETRHCLRRVGWIQEYRFRACGELDRFARLRRWYAVTAADEAVVDINRRVGECARVLRPGGRLALYWLMHHSSLRGSDSAAAKSA